MLSGIPGKPKPRLCHTHNEPLLNARDYYKAFKAIDFRVLLAQFNRIHLWDQDENAERVVDSAIAIGPSMPTVAHMCDVHAASAAPHTTPNIIVVTTPGSQSTALVRSHASSATESDCPIIVGRLSVEVGACFCQRSRATIPLTTSVRMT